MNEEAVTLVTEEDVETDKKKETSIIYEGF
jgi:hypothetical protein